MKLMPARISILLLVVVLTACSGLMNGNKSTQSSSAEDTSKPGDLPNLNIASCDDYIQKFIACVSENIPEETKAMLLAALEQSKIQWRQALSSGMAPEVVSQSCLAALETAKQTMAQYSCSW